MNISHCRGTFLKTIRKACRLSSDDDDVPYSTALAELRSNGRVFANRLRLGGVAERLIAPVLKTGRPKGLVSSNLTPSASLIIRHLRNPAMKV